MSVSIWCTYNMQRVWNTNTPSIAVNWALRCFCWAWTFSLLFRWPSSMSARLETCRRRKWREVRSDSRQKGTRTLCATCAIARERDRARRRRYLNSRLSRKGNCQVKNVTPLFNQSRLKGGTESHAYTILHERSERGKMKRETNATIPVSNERRETVSSESMWKIRNMTSKWS